MFVDDKPLSYCSTLVRSRVTLRMRLRKQLCHNMAWKSESSPFYSTRSTSSSREC